MVRASRWEQTGLWVTVMQLNTDTLRKRKSCSYVITKKKNLRKFCTVENMTVMIATKMCGMACMTIFCTSELYMWLLSATVKNLILKMPNICYSSPVHSESLWFPCRYWGEFHGKPTSRGFSLHPQPPMLRCCPSWQRLDAWWWLSQPYSLGPLERQQVTLLHLH